jgi:hypothetical protein
MCNLLLQRQVVVLTWVACIPVHVCFCSLAPVGACCAAAGRAQFVFEIDSAAVALDGGNQ